MPSKPFASALAACLILSLLATSPFSVDALGQEPVKVSRNLDRKLKRDAARLALRLNQQEDLRFQAIHIADAQMLALYESLLTLYKGDQDVRSVFRCNVHTRPDPSIDHMLIIFDRNIEWAAPLREGRHETNSITLNDLLYEHDLIIEKHVQWDDSRDAIAIRSKRPLNMASLANEFYNLEGVQEIDLGLAKDAGNDITARRTAEGWQFTFLLSFGSLAEQGEKVHRWQYEISDSGSITKVSEGGHPVPEWMRCSTLDLQAISAITR